VPPMSKHMPKEREREREIGTPPEEWQKGGDGQPPRSGSSGKRENERETTLPPLSSLCLTLPPLRDVVCRQVGTTGGEHQLKHPRAGTKPLTDSPGWLLPT
jgi:hypothetical protein